MTDTWFYHLETTPLEQTLPELLEKVVQKGWRAYVHFAASGHDDDRFSGLNERLWAYRPDSFLAHGVEGNDLEAHQPILLGTSGALVNQPDVYVSAAPVEMPDVSGLERCLIVFDGNDPEHLNWARVLWKQMKATGGQLAYWKQNDGRWEKMS